MSSIITRGRRTTSPSCFENGRSEGPWDFSGEYRQRRVKYFGLQAQPALTERAGLTVNRQTVGEIGKHHTLAEISNRFGVGNDRNDLLVQTVTQVIKIRRTGD